MVAQVSVKVKKQRYRRAMALQQKVSRQVQQSFVDQTLRVLIEKKVDGVWSGRSHADAPEIDGSVLVRGVARVGEFVNARITAAAEYDLVGEV